jgi:tyrosyl-tRNA synthetase
VIVRDSLESRLKSGRKLRIKLGADPSRPDLHLGHAVVLGKLKEFQQLGHQVVFIIGDFTAKIGDPTGKSKTRPMLSDEEIKKNAETYFRQVGRVIDMSKCEIRYNSEWLSGMTAANFIDLASKFTVARILERDDFTNRFRSNSDIYIHELLYPMLQAYDSIILRADVEIGATDQKFNMLAGRDLARRVGTLEQDVITCSILVGTDGVRKMSKSLDNYIGLDDSADDMFGKTMSIPDTALVNWMELATDYDQALIDLEKANLASGTNPRDVKMRLARRIVAMYHGEEAAARAQQEFVERFQNKHVPTEIPEKIVVNGQSAVAVCAELFALSKSEARRIIEQGGIRFDGVTVGDPMSPVHIPDEGIIVNKGKLHFVRIKAR